MFGLDSLFSKKKAVQPAESGKAKAAAKKVALPAFLQELGGLLAEDAAPEEAVVPNEAEVLAAYLALVNRVRIRSWWIVGLLTAVVLLLPVLRPIYYYEAVAPDKTQSALVALSAPNLTDQAVLSWAATSITEIMTFGFGDFDRRILGQRHLFTDDGWTSFTKAIREKNMREQFKLRQLVLTAVPSNMPVIVSRGVNESDEHIWVIEMPIIMTYTTNNNVTERRRGIVNLTLVRVPSRQNVAGIGIKTWMLI